MKPKRLLWLGIAGLFLFMLIRLPVGLFAGQLPQPWQLGEVSGSLWHGQATQLGTRGQLLLSGLRWDWQPGALLKGRLAWQVSAQHEQNRGHALLSVGAGGWRAEDVDAVLPLAPLLAGDPQLGPLQIGGNLAVQAHKLSQSEWDGVAATLSDAHSAVTPQANPFGSYRLQSKRNGADIAWQIMPLQGTLQIDGSGVLPARGPVQGQLRFTPAPGQEALFAPLLQRLGGGAGGYTLQLGKH